MSLHRIPLTRHTHSLSFPSFLLPPFRILCVYPYNLNSRRRRWRSLPASGVYHPACISSTTSWLHKLLPRCSYQYVNTRGEREGGREGGEAFQLSARNRTTEIVTTGPSVLSVPSSAHLAIYTHTAVQFANCMHTLRHVHTHTLSLSVSVQSEFYTRAKLQSAVAHPLDHAIPGYALCFLGRGMMRYTGANIYHLNQLRGNEWWYVRTLLTWNEGRKR